MPYEGLKPRSEIEPEIFRSLVKFPAILKSRDCPNSEIPVDCVEKRNVLAPEMEISPKFEDDGRTNVGGKLPGRALLFGGSITGGFSVQIE